MINHSLLNQTLLVLTISLKTIQSGGLLPNMLLLGWMKLSSDTPTALYGIPRLVSYLLPDLLFERRSALTAT
jgi:hypothetical protein